MKRKLTAFFSASIMLFSMACGLSLMPLVQADDLSSLKSSALVWFDSTKGITADSNGKISKWADQSGNGHDAIQTDPNFQPVVKSNAINGVPSLVFENSKKGDNQYKTGQFLEFSGVDLNSPTGAQLTTVVVCKPNMDMPTVRTPGYSNLNGGTVLHFNETGGWGSVFMGVYSDKVSLRYGTGSSYKPVRGWEYTRPESETGFTYTYGWKYGSLEALYVNGEKIAYTDDALKFYYGTSVDDGIGVINNSRTSTVIDKTDTVGRIGKGYYVSNNGTELTGSALDGVYFDGEICEVIIFDKALSDQQIDILNNYIENKYDISSQVKPETTIPSSGQVLAWFDAGKGLTVDSNGKVTKWEDQSGKGNHATATDAKAPLKVDQAINNKPAIRFNGSGNAMDFNGVDINQPSNVQLTMVVISKAAMNAPVGNPDDGRTTQVSNLLAFRGSSWSGTTFNIYKNKVSARFGYGLLSTNDYAYQRGWVYTPDDNSVLNEFNYAYAIKNGRQENIYLNGSVIQDNLLYYRAGDTARMPIDALSSESSAHYGATVDRLTGNYTTGHIGWNGSDSYYAGDIAEIIIYKKALNDSEIKQLNKYINEKYGLPLPEQKINPNKDSASPFKDLLVWYDSSDGVVADENGKVSQWNDKSGNGNNAEQNVDIFKPLLKTDPETGLKSLVFESSVKSDQLVSDAKDKRVGQFLEFYNADLNSANAKLTTVIVSKSTANLPVEAAPDKIEQVLNLGVPLFFNESGSWGQVFMGVFKNAVTLRFGSGDSKFGTRGWLYTRPESTNDLTFTYGVKDGTKESVYVNGQKVGGDNLRLYFNMSGEGNCSAEEAEENNRISAAVANTESRATIGRGRVHNSYRDYAYFEGEIFEIMIFKKALDQDEIEGLTSYLNHKYNGAEAKEPVISETEVVAIKSTAPELPEKVTVIDYVNYTVSEVEVEWNDIDDELYGKAGTFTVEGTVKGYDKKAVAKIYVIDPFARDSYGSVPSGAMAWYSASYGGLKEKDGKLYWEDRSGNGRDAVAYSSYNAPTYLPAGSGNLFGSFRFDGIDDFLMLSGFDFNRQNAKFTVVAVTKPESDMPDIEENMEQNANLQVPLAFDEIMPWGQLYLGTFKDKVTMRFGVGADGTVDDLDVRGWIYDRPEPVSGFTTTIGVKNGENESIYVDGEKVEGAVLYSLYGTTSPNTRSISSYGWIGKGKAPNKGTDTYFKGEIAEIIIYDRALSDSEMKNLNDYLNYKYLNIEPKPEQTNPTETTNPAKPGETSKPADGTKSPSTGETALPLAVAFVGFAVSAAVLRKSRFSRSGK